MIRFIASAVIYNLNECLCISTIYIHQASLFKHMSSSSSQSFLKLSPFYLFGKIDYSTILAMWIQNERKSGPGEGRKAQKFTEYSDKLVCPLQQIDRLVTIIAFEWCVYGGMRGIWAISTSRWFNS